MKMLLGLLVCAVATAADSVPTPPQSDVLALVGCSLRSSFGAEVATHADPRNQYKYSAGFSRSADGRSMTAVMFIGKVEAVLVEGMVSKTRVAILNVARFHQQEEEWRLDETHAGSQNAVRVSEVASKLAKLQPKLLKMPSDGTDKRTCVGIGLP